MLRFCTEATRILARCCGGCAGLNLERSREDRCQERALPAGAFPESRFDVAHHSLVAGCLQKWLFAMIFPPCVNEGGSVTGGGESSHRSHRKQEAEAKTGGPDRITQRL